MRTWGPSTGAKPLFITGRFFAWPNVSTTRCYLEVVQSIVNAGADFRLAIKRHQGRLYTASEAFFDTVLNEDAVNRRPGKHLTEKTRAEDYLT